MQSVIANLDAQRPTVQQRLAGAPAIELEDETVDDDEETPRADMYNDDDDDVATAHQTLDQNESLAPVPLPDVIVPEEEAIHTVESVPLPPEIRVVAPDASVTVTSLSTTGARTTPDAVLMPPPPPRTDRASMSTTMTRPGPVEVPPVPRVPVPAPPPPPDSVVTESIQPPTTGPVNPPVPPSSVPHTMATEPDPVNDDERQALLRRAGVRLGMAAALHSN